MTAGGGEPIDQTGIHAGGACRYPVATLRRGQGVDLSPPPSDIGADAVTDTDTNPSSGSGGAHAPGLEAMLPIATRARQSPCQRPAETPVRSTISTLQQVVDSTRRCSPRYGPRIHAGARRSRASRAYTQIG